MANQLLALQVKSPDVVDSFNQGQEVGQKLQANNLANLIEKQKYDQQQTAIARQNQLYQLYQQNAPALFGEDDAARQAALGQIGAVDPTGALKLSTDINTAKTNQFKAQKDKLDYFDNSLGSILDAPADKQEQIYQEKIAEAKRLGIPVNAPANFDPAWVKAKHGEVLTAKDRLDQQDKDRKDKLDAANKPFNADGTPNTAYQNYEITKTGEAARVRAGAQGAAGSADPELVGSWVTAVKRGNATMQQVPQAVRNDVAVSLAQEPKDAYSPQASQRLTMAASRITAPFTKMPQYELTAGGKVYLQRIDAALKHPGSVSDQDLLDSLTKLNTGGNAVTDAQIKVITDGKSFSDWAGTLGNKFRNGGVLSESQRKQIHDIANDIFANYKKGYQPIYNQATSQLRAAGIPEAFWTIPDLNKLDDAESAAATRIPLAAPGGPQSAWGAGAQSGNKNIRWEDMK